MDKLFSKLNYNTHTESVAILVGPDDETITYLNTFTKPSIYFNKNISLLDLVANTNKQSEFFLLYSGDKKPCFLNSTMENYIKNMRQKKTGLLRILGDIRARLEKQQEWKGANKF
ncbi:MAG TPA: hypothetical protein VIJ75_05650 [Hanamia sp.]